MTSRSDFISLGQDRLHIQTLSGGHENERVLCLHGAFSSGRVFYNADYSRGLAPFLAGHGFDVSVLDFRGHGKSTPLVNSKSRYGMFAQICEEMPAVFKHLTSSSPKPMHLIAHSDGGVILCSFLARYPEWRKFVATVTLMGTKRCIRAVSVKKLLAIDLLWYPIAPILGRILGYTPARRLGLGSDNDTSAFTQERMAWLKGKPWKGDDSFDYYAAWHQSERPKLRAYAAVDDPYLGNPVDVRAFLLELGYEDKDLTLLSRGTGFKKDYNHGSMLTDRMAASDHFLDIVKWLGH